MLKSDSRALSTSPVVGERPSPKLMTSSFLSANPGRPELAGSDRARLEFFGELRHGLPVFGHDDVGRRAADRHRSDIAKAVFGRPCAASCHPCQGQRGDAPPGPLGQAGPHEMHHFVAAQLDRLGVGRPVACEPIAPCRGIWAATDVGGHRRREHHATACHIDSVHNLAGANQFAACLCEHRGGDSAVLVAGDLRRRKRPAPPAAAGLGGTRLGGDALAGVRPRHRRAAGAGTDCRQIVRLGDYAAVPGGLLLAGAFFDRPAVEPAHRSLRRSSSRVLPVRSSTVDDG